jgi:hypothetical protein
VGLPQSLRDMGELNKPARRRTFRWPGAAREMVRIYLNSTPSEFSGKGEHDARIGLKTLITRIAAVSGNPRGACWRFVRQSGVTSKRSYRQWTRNEQQKLLDLIASHTLQEVTVLLRRSPTSVRAMLHRLGASARMGLDSFTKHTLAEALHVRADEVQKWIDRGLLRSRIIETNGLRRKIIDAEDFCDFCKGHRREIVGHRLNADRLSFVQTFVFPPSHMELLPVREAKKEQAAYDEQMKKEAGWEEDVDDQVGATDVGCRSTTIGAGHR